MNGWHVAVIIIVSIALVVLFVGALISILRSTGSTTAKAVWIVLSFIFPVLGPLVWFVTGRRSLPRAPAT